MSTFPRRVHPSTLSAAHRARTPLFHASFVSSESATHASKHTRGGPESTSTSIPDLREAINSLDSKMASLMHERHALETHLERAVRLQAPIHRIPSELLSHMFVIGVLDAADDNPVMISTLMLVCRCWSQRVLDTPLLWSRISVGPHDSLEKARRKLTRSKACPLDITVNFVTRTEYVSNVTEQVVHAMDLIRPALWRTRSFSLSVPSRPQAHAALLRCQEDAPLLETLCIRIYRSMQDDRYSSPPLPLFNGHTPRLRSCSLTSFNFGWDHRLVSRLHILNLEGYFNGFTPTAPVLIGILRQCPELEELSLRNLSDVDSDPCFPSSATSHTSPDDVFQQQTSTAKVCLPRLRKITFYYAGIVLARQIMTSITFPNLQSLEMSYLQNVTPILQLLYDQALVHLPLRVLHIESCLFNELKFVNLLRRLPSLVELGLVDVEDASSGFLKGLSSSQPWVCPKLESLLLDGCTSIDWDSLRTFVESRLPSNSYPRYHDAQTFRLAPLTFTSASSAATRTTRTARKQTQTFITPQRLRTIDVTRCHQMSKEMVQWLRMYVAEVKCEPAKGVWGEPMPL